MNTWRRSAVFCRRTKPAQHLDRIRRWRDRASVPRQLMAEQTRADWRAPTDKDWRRLRTLLRDVMLHLRTDAEMFEEAEKDFGIGRYAERAARSRELATWVEDEYRALEGGHQRKVPLDDRSMFPGTLAP